MTDEELMARCEQEAERLVALPRNRAILAKGLFDFAKSGALPLRSVPHPAPRQALVKPPAPLPWWRRLLAWAAS